MEAFEFPSPVQNEVFDQIFPYEMHEVVLERYWESEQPYVGQERSTLYAKLFG